MHNALLIRTGRQVSYN